MYNPAIILYRTKKRTAHERHLPRLKVNIEDSGETCVLVTNDRDKFKNEIDEDATYFYNQAVDYEEKEDYSNMIKCYLNADTADALFNLGCYYDLCRDYVRMVKCYVRAIDKGCTDAMFNLASYCEEQQEHELMIKYYLMAANKGCDDALYNLGLYYEEIQDSVNMYKYYTLAAKKNHLLSIEKLKEIEKIEN